MPDTLPACGQPSLPWARFCYSCSTAAITFFHLQFRKPFHVPHLEYGMGWNTPFPRRGSAFRISGPRKLGEPALGREQNSMVNSESLPGLEACLGRFGSQSFPGVHCLPGPLAVSGPGWRPLLAWAPAGRGVCHQLRQVSGPGRQGQAHPSQEGGSSPLFWAGCGCWHKSSRSMLETRQTLTNSARFPLTSLQPYLVAQPKPEAPRHLSLPGLKGLGWPLAPCLDCHSRANGSA